MGRTGTFVALAAMVLVGILGGLASWASTGDAARPVEIVYDNMVRSMTGRDPFSRCYRRRQFQPLARAVASSFEQRDRGCFGPRERIRGIYISEFEGEFFLENVSPSETYIVRCPWTSLIIDDLSDLTRFPAFHTPQPTAGRAGLWHVEFVGRRSPDWNTWDAAVAYRGTPKAITVDHLISARLLRTYTGYSGYGDASFIKFVEDNCYL